MTAQRVDRGDRLVDGRRPVRVDAQGGPGPDRLADGGDALRVVREARRRGAIVRPLGDVIVLMPPLSITKEDLGRLLGVVAKSIRAAYPVAELDAGAKGRLGAALLEAA